MQRNANSAGASATGNHVTIRETTSVARDGLETNAMTCQYYVVTPSTAASACYVIDARNLLSASHSDVSMAALHSYLTSTTYITWRNIITDAAIIVLTTVSGHNVTQPAPPSIPSETITSTTEPCLFDLLSRKCQKTTEMKATTSYKCFYRETMHSDEKLVTSEAIY